MTAPLLHAVNNINQKLADTFTSSYYRWDSNQNVWYVQRTSFGKYFHWLNWHRVWVIAYTLWFLFGSTYSCLVWVNFPGILEIQDVILVALVVLSVMPLVLLLEYGYMKYALEFCAFNNWGNQKLLELTTQKSRPRKMSKSTVFQLLVAEYSKIYHGNKNDVDWWGVLAFNLYFFLYPTSYTLPTVLVFADMDLSYILLFILSSPKLLSLPPIYKNIPLKIFLSLFQGLMFQSSAMTICTCTLMLANAFEATMGISKYLKSMPSLNQQMLRLYGEFYLGQYLVSPMHKLCNTLFLSSSFFVLVFAINLTILGYAYLSFKFYIIAPIILVSVLVFVLVVLLGEVYVFQETSELLSSWKWLTHRGRCRSLAVRKMLRSCRPVSFPCGDIGIVDRDIKVNYMLAVLDRSIEVLLLLKV